MLSYISGTGSLEGSRYLSPLRLETPNAQPGRERLRHLVIGSPDGVRGAINHLHLLQYAERLEWSRQFTIPESGILITPEQGEVFSLLLRDLGRQLDRG
ncbi:hypothetical protein ACQ4N7_26815 [Nodosilinea sp. AN01ver1]|uniref:hypothetical protein n=1 Tax=Nodosilinea sp. AN01ver1 TaxID=3423362 RepID=UPI003D310BDE